MSTETKANRPSAQAGHVTFELHTLGWEAFQNLCGHIAREILGQTVTEFSPSCDAGQDGAFQGSWRRTKEEAFTGRFVIQCKFTASRDKHLSLGDLKQEVEKAKSLASRGLAQTYLLMTNAKLSGVAANTIREAFLKIRGVEYFELFGSEWITQQILGSKHLRAYVPRLYGLGDLSQILDARVYSQTYEILQTWRSNLATFVPTEAHHDSVKALRDTGCVLLLGDPMSGKSTIAAALAIAAADLWKCIPIFASHPDDFKTHWNPEEPNQFFWVDDAFGQTQFDPSLAAGWSRLFPHLTAALRTGTRILFTSRNYIYRSAKRELKENGFPLIRNSPVLIQVENLRLEEKERILYNHIHLGSQPAEFRRAIKPFLPSIAASSKFFPEVARRLGNPFFTKSLSMHPDRVREFVEEPKQFLGDVIEQLNGKDFAALSLLFMRAGRSAIPLEIEAGEVKAITQLGADLAQLRESLSALEGSLVARSFEAGEQLWKFRHPSIRDAMATYVAARPDLIDIYLGGVKAPELLKEVVCGDLKIAGAKVQVPVSRFSAVISKVRGVRIEDWDLRHTFLSFLENRSSTDFVAAWFAACRDDFERLCQVPFVWSYNFWHLLLRLHRLGCLSEAQRRVFVLKAIERIVEYAETIVLCTDIRELLTPEEVRLAHEQVRNGLVPSLASIIHDVANEYSDQDESPSRHFRCFSDKLDDFRNYFEHLEDTEMVEAFEYGQSLVEESVARLENYNRREQEAKRMKEEADQMDEELLAVEQEQLQAQDPEGASDDSEGTVWRATAIPQVLSVIQASSRNIFDDVDS